MWLGDNKISDYRVYVDKESRLVAVVFIAGDVQMRVTVNATDAQKLVDALTRAVSEIKTPEARH